MRVLIVDDEEPARRRLRRLLEEIGGVEICGEAENGVDALEAISSFKPALVLLDIQMPLLSGLELVRELRTTDAPMIVFVTSYDQYALEAFEVSAVDYLLKPVSRERLEKSLTKVGALLHAKAGAQVTIDAIERLTAALANKPKPLLERIVGHRGQKVFLLTLDKVQAFVADDELVFALLADGRMLVNYTLRDLESRLDPQRFARVHKQTIVNLNHLVELEPILKGGATARLANGQSIEISRRYATGLRERLGW
ncbi:MAG TPA: response regulator [Bryobacteraceae bacterium]|nr:response regulator [Bryobacteraceae bacterium]